MKDFTCVHSNGKYIVYFTTVNSAGNWGGGMMTFNSWPEMATAPQYQLAVGGTFAYAVLFRPEEYLGSNIPVGCPVSDLD